MRRVTSEADLDKVTGIRKAMDHRTIMQGVFVRIAVGVFGMATLAMLLLALYNDHGYFAVHAQALKLKALQENIKALENENKDIQRREQAAGA